jgi:flagellar biosynthesis protein FlhA
LVAQVPALIVSVAAGILVTRASGDSNLGSHISKQLTLYPRAIAVASAMLFAFGLIPGMPMLPFFILGVAAAAVARAITKSRAARAAAKPTDQVALGKMAAEKPKPVAADFEKLIDTDVFSIELGNGLLKLAEKKQGGDLLDRVTGVRKTFAREMGMIVPPIAIRDNLELGPNEYRFLLRNKQVARGQILANRWLAMNVANSPVKLHGQTTVEPVFGINATWIGQEERRTAEINGYTVVDPASVLITHLSECIKRFSNHILGRQDVQALIDHLKERNPTLVNELIPDLVNVGIIQRVLQNLLKEGISIKNLGVIMECIADYAPISKNPDELSEQVRKRLGTYFVSEFETEPGLIKAITLDPRLEQLLITKVQKTQYDVGLMIDPQLAQHVLTELTRRMTDMAEQNLTPITIVSAELRLAFKRFFEPSLTKLVVLSYQELPSQTEIQNLSIIVMPQTARRPAETAAA